MLFFYEGRFASLVLMIALSVLLWYYIERAKQGKPEKIRILPAVEMIEEAISRATEMGRPVLLTFGPRDDLRPASLVGIGAVRYISKMAVEKGAELLIPVSGPRSYPLALENYRLGCIEGGVPEAYKEENVFFLGNEQFAYTDGIMGIMEERNIGASIFLGPFMVEGLHLGLASKRIGALSIGGVDTYTMGAFMFITCDYTIMGSELFAAGAYMSRDTETINGIAPEDMIKWCLAIFTLLGTLAGAFGSNLFLNILGL